MEHKRIIFLYFGNNRYLSLWAGLYGFHFFKRLNYIEWKFGIVMLKIGL